MNYHHLVLVGLSGSGKSTLLNLIAALNRVSTRTVRRWMAEGLEVTHVDGRAYVAAM